MGQTAGRLSTRWSRSSTRNCTQQTLPAPNSRRDFRSLLPWSPVKMPSPPPPPPPPSSIWQVKSSLHRPPQSRHRSSTQAAAATSTQKNVNGWGIVAVLNELEQTMRPSNRNSNSCSKNGSTKTQAPLRFGRRIQQDVCLNCRALFFRPPPGTPRTEFCSLDCRSSHAYAQQMQSSVDRVLELELKALEQPSRWPRCHVMNATSRCEEGIDPEEEEEEDSLAWQCYS